MKNLTTIIVIILMSGMSITTTAQNNQPFGEWGKAGIFLKLTDDLTQVKSGGFEILRNDSGSKTSLGKVVAPANKMEFEKRLKFYHRFLPEFKIPRPQMINKLWEQFAKNKMLDSLYFWGTTPVVQLSLGAMFLDTSAVKNELHSYLIKYLDKNGNIIKELISNEIEYKDKAVTGEIRFSNKVLQNNMMFLYFVAKPPYPSAVKLFRRPRVNQPFEEVYANVGFTEVDGKLNIVPIDASVDSGSVYQYFITPLDRFGKEGNNSDTVFCGVYDFSKAFLPGRFKAESDPELRGIKLSWDSVYYPFVTGIAIERSDIFDSLFTQIAEIPLTQTAFVDHNAEPMKKYFYRLKLIGAMNEESPYSARVFGMYEDKTAPLPPFALSGKGLENGVELKWITVEPFIKGFYVYRNNGVDDSLTLVSGLVPPGDSITVYRDTSEELQAGYSYLYSVVAENTSHVRSAFSDTISVVTLKKEKLIPPTNLQAILEKNGVQLYWDDMRSINRTVIGYNVFKKEITDGKSDAKPEKLDTLLFPESNNFFDAEIADGKDYEYFVQSVGLNGSLSEPSEGITVKRENNIPLAPANISVNATEKGISVKWNKPIDDSIAKFILYRFQRGKKAQKIAEFSCDGSNEYFDSTVKKGELYFYYIVSINKQNVESRASKEVGAIIE